MPSAFFETPLSSYLRWHKIDTVVVTGGSTSGCVRATAVDALSYGFRTIVPIETCADKHESYHFANLTDLQLKYADVAPVQAVIDWLEARCCRKVRPPQVFTISRPGGVARSPSGSTARRSRYGSPPPWNLAWKPRV